MPRRFALALLAMASLAVATAPGNRVPTASAASTLDRPADPVVLTGADVPWLIGAAPGNVVAFRYDGAWQQIPVQVDERALKDFGDIYNLGGQYGGVSELVYTDAGTFTGPDPDATLDADDEIVFMAKDAGGELPSLYEPGGVIPNSGVELAIADPLDPAAAGYVYLFRSDGTLDPGAGQQYVTYAFNLLSGSYLETYNTPDGPNPEDSVATTPYYSHHFSDRWISDEIHVTTGAATGVDILDRHKNLFAPGVCSRSEDTFSNGEGAFIANKSGLVRAIRSYVGANSGPLTQRDNIFYERRQEIRTFLRVHAISGMMDFFDYSPDAAGITYYNDLNLSGVTIDGEPDSVTAGPIEWQLVDGPQGALVITGSLSTNIAGLTYTSYYLDDSTPSVTQCTGDAFAYGSSGLWINQGIPCTDPLQGCTHFLHGIRNLYYEAPGVTTAEAEEISNETSAPLTFVARQLAQDPTDWDGDGVADDADNCPYVYNPAQTNTNAQTIDNAPVVAGDDVTNPYGDAVGDACDSDDDNDWLDDVDEAAVGADPLDRDSDGDRVLDGAEVLLGSNPLDPDSRPSCAGIVDDDRDCLPAHVEAAFGSSDAIKDTDGDGINDGIEVKGWGTSPVAGDSDGDGCDDDKEIADVNGDAVANALDYVRVAQRVFGVQDDDPDDGDPVPDADMQVSAAFDVNKDGVMSALDPVLAALNSSLVEPAGECDCR